MNTRRTPTNTTKQAQRDPESFLLDAIGMGTSRAIEHQEETGQRELVNDEVLPTKLNGQKPLLEKLGFQFLGEVKDDLLFQHVEMPAGWRKRATDHSMWSELVDAQGRKRGMIFYKAAFYDRDAFMHLVCRYSVRRDYDIKDSAVHRIMDGETVIQTMPALEIDPERKWEAGDKSSAAAYTWLAANYPDFKDPLAYFE